MNKTDRTLKILLDTNFLIVPFQFRLNLQAEFDKLLDRKYELILLKEIYDELNHILKKSNGKKRQEIQAAIKYFESFPKQDLSKREPNENIDDFLVRVALENKYIVATNDKGLKRKLRRLKINYIDLRQRNHFKIKNTLI